MKYEVQFEYTTAVKNRVYGGRAGTMEVGLPNQIEEADIEPIRQAIQEDVQSRFKRAKVIAISIKDIRQI